MDTRTTEIRRFDENELAALTPENRRRLIELSPDDVRELEPANRRERRAWAAKKRREQRLARRAQA